MNKKYFYSQLFFTILTCVLIYGVSFLFLIFPIHAFAGTASDYQSAESYISSNNLPGQLSSSVSQKNLPITVNNNPTQTQYYKNSGAISGDAEKQVTQSGTTGNAVDQDALSRPRYTVNMNSPEMQTGQLITQNASSIADGTYKDCDKKSFTKVTYTNKTCQTEQPLNFSCSRILNVEVQKNISTSDQTQNLPGRVTSNHSPTATVHLDYPSGIIKSLSMHVRDASNPWGCHRTYFLAINGKVIANSRGSCDRRLGDLQFDASNLQINFSNNAFQMTLMGGGLSGNFTGNVVVSVQTETNTPIDHWGSSCSNVPNQCQIQSTCTDPNETRTISGVPVTRTCWKYQDAYQCGGQLSSDCTALENNGCTQVGSVCVNPSPQGCSLYSETWSCPDKQVIGNGIVCGTQLYCMDGSCQQTSNDKNKDFGKSITQLAAASSAANDVKNQNVNPDAPYSVSMFTGQEGECRVDAVGFENCCSNTGWGNGILANCSDAEKHLGFAKEKGVVVATGEYCRHKFLGFCTEHRKTYCIFPSKLAFDIQVYGRQDQLGRNFGNGKNTNCSGISATDIQNINFSKINFSNVISDIQSQTNLPTSQAEQQEEQEIQSRISNHASTPNPSPYSKDGF